MIEAGFYLSFD